MLRKKETAEQNKGNWEHRVQESTVQKSGEGSRETSVRRWNLNKNLKEVKEFTNPWGKNIPGGGEGPKGKHVPGLPGLWALPPPSP